MDLRETVASWPPSEELSITYLVTDERPRPLGLLTSDGAVVARVRTGEHRHLSVLIDAGFQLLADLLTPSPDPVLRVRIRAVVD